MNVGVGGDVFLRLRAERSAGERAHQAALDQAGEGVAVADVAVVVHIEPQRSHGSGRREERGDGDVRAAVRMNGEPGFADSQTREAGFGSLADVVKLRQAEDPIAGRQGQAGEAAAGEGLREQGDRRVLERVILTRMRYRRDGVGDGFDSRGNFHVSFLLFHADDLRQPVVTLLFRRAAAPLSTPPAGSGPRRPAFLSGSCHEFFG